MCRERHVCPVCWGNKGMEIFCSWFRSNVVMLRRMFLPPAFSIRQDTKENRLKGEVEKKIFF